MKIFSKIKIKFQKYRKRQQQKFIDELFFYCFPKLTKEEAEELRKYIDQKFKDDRRTS